MTKDNENKHDHNPLHDHELEKDEVHEVLEFLRHNGMSIAIAVAIGVVASLGVVFYRGSQKQKREYAAQALSAADSAESLTAITEEYAGTPSAPVAMLELAAQRFQEGDYSDAMAKYKDFKKKYPEHEMAAAVDVCILLCQEASGSFDAAIAAADAFIADNPDHFMLPAASFAKARCLMEKGELEEARTLYEDYIAANPEDSWTVQAESSLEYVKQQIRARKVASN